MINDPNAALIERKLTDWHFKISGLHRFI